MADPIRQFEAEASQPDTSYDTSDKESVNKARKKAARTRADRLRFVEAAMGHAEGRAWFYDILTFCKVFKTPFGDDPYTTAFSCGEQNIGYRILDDVQTAAPDRYMDMIKENASRNG